MMKLTGTLFALADKNNKEENKRATSGGGVVTIRRAEAIAIRSIVCVCGGDIVFVVVVVGCVMLVLRDVGVA